MNSRCIKLKLSILFGCCYIIGFSQSNFESLGESAVAVNHTVSNAYKVNFALKSRYYLYKENTLTYTQRQIDVVHFSTLKLRHNKSLSLGLQYRNRTIFNNLVGNEVRLTQQFNSTKTPHNIRFGHRFRTEQRLLKNQTIYRQRYRFAVDCPLNGEKLDIGETYLVSSTEFLLSLNNSMKPEWDNRITSQIGWQTSKTLKLQIGAEYRFEAFNLKTEHRLFILTSAIVKM
ncbi:hypothetical protein PK35_13305 [Tamlana nanhaiensis]|uniref:DUF2490 domain-containing protein n=1 Tax=Neotamlana nanhaiensis TaxID=1382798 RepID=A0A0D7VXY9_9FLAO|nr:DUF2490 domain-containing protein [Tamlana nanhaiensis]KJD31726.1 hypothetical protein PK35_13305 [Tamlana nanhaiensis]